MEKPILTLEITVSRADIYGNRYAVGFISNRTNGKSTPLLQYGYGDGSNWRIDFRSFCAYIEAIDIVNITDEMPIRQFNRLAKGAIYAADDSTFIEQIKNII